MDIAKLIEAGAGGLLLISILVFLNYMKARDQQVTEREKQWQAFLEKRDAEWQAFIRGMNETDNKVLGELRDVIAAVKTELASLRTDFHEHEEWERGVLEPRTRQTRKQ